MELNTRPLGENFGLEVLDVDLAQADPETVSALYALWQDEPLLLLRRQCITETEMVGFSRNFGELEILVRDDMLSPQHPEVIYVTNLRNEAGKTIGGLGSYELKWHTDQSYRLKPATGSIFMAVEMPEGQGETSWCNTQLAYEALPAELQQEIEQYKGVTRYGLNKESSYLRDISDPKEIEKIANRTPDASHPMVLTHPKTRKKSLYVDISKTFAIEGLEPERGEPLLRELGQIMTRPEFVYRHAWRPGDVMMWENSRLCHRREPFDASLPRLAKRTTIFMNPADFPVPA